MSHIQTITVKNLKAISSLEADFKGCSVIVVGGNNKGKSTLLKTFPDRLRGEKPELIVKEGENNGIAEMLLTTGEKFTWSFSKDGKEKLTFITREGIKTSCTMEIRNRFFPPLFDVDEFLQSTPKEQSSMLQKLVKIDFNDIDKRYKEAFDDRTFRNRQLKETEARTIPLNESLPLTEIDYSDIVAEISKIDSQNQLYQERADKYVSIENSKNDILLEIEKLTAQVKVLEEQMENVSNWLKDPVNIPKDNAVELNAKITEISVQNQAIKANNDMRIEHERLRSTKILAEKADALVKKIEQERKDLLSGAKLPNGFEITIDGITVDGLPLSKKQLSTSKLYISALQLAALQLGDTKTLHFDASPLDRTSLMEILQWAESNDLQLLIEKPDFDGGEIEYVIVSESSDIQIPKAVHLQEPIHGNNEPIDLI